MAGPAPSKGCQGPLDIVLTNDDGWSAPGIQTLRAALIKAGHRVTLVAPLANQSGKGGAFTTGGPLTIKRQVDDGANDQWSVDGTPVDAVRAALEAIHADELPDLVISGSNFGENTGRTIASASGTVGAAYFATANRNGSVPSIDISVGLNPAEAPLFPSTVTAMPEAGAFATRLVGALQADCRGGRLLPEHHQLHVNYPARPAAAIKGVKVESMGDLSTLDIATHDPLGAVAAGGGALSLDFTMNDPALLTGDARAYAQGYIAIVPLDGDMTASTVESKRLRNAIAKVAPRP